MVAQVSIAVGDCLNVKKKKTRFSNMQTHETLVNITLVTHRKQKPMRFLETNLRMTNSID